MATGDTKCVVCGVSYRCNEVDKHVSTKRHKNFDTIYERQKADAARSVYVRFYNEEVDESLLQTHFSKFGVIERIVFRSNERFAIVEFAAELAANEALAIRNKHSIVLNSGKKMQLRVREKTMNWITPTLGKCKPSATRFSTETCSEKSTLETERVDDDQQEHTAQSSTPSNEVDLVAQRDETPWDDLLAKLRAASSFAEQLKMFYSEMALKDHEKLQRSSALTVIEREIRSNSKFVAAELTPFGSFACSLSTASSDVDVHLEFGDDPANDAPAENEEDAMEHVRVRLLELARRLKVTRLFKRVDCILSKRCPLMRIQINLDTLNESSASNSNLAGRSLPNVVKFDVSSMNKLGIFNTKLIDHYCSSFSDGSIRFFVFALRELFHVLTTKGATRRFDSHRLTSYAFEMLIIFWLANARLDEHLLATDDGADSCELEGEVTTIIPTPARLASFIREAERDRMVIERWLCAVPDSTCESNEYAVLRHRIAPLQLDLVRLVRNFFAYFAGLFESRGQDEAFDFAELVFNVRDATIAKREAVKRDTPEFHTAPHLNVQDPFELTHNLTAQCSAAHRDAFVHFVKTANQLCNSPQFETKPCTDDSDKDVQTNWGLALLLADMQNETRDFTSSSVKPPVLSANDQREAADAQSDSFSFCIDCSRGRLAHSFIDELRKEAGCVTQVAEPEWELLAPVWYRKICTFLVDTVLRSALRMSVVQLDSTTGGEHDSQIQPDTPSADPSRKRHAEQSDEQPAAKRVKVEENYAGSTIGGTQRFACSLNTCTMKSRRKMNGVLKQSSANDYSFELEAQISDRLIVEGNSLNGQTVEPGVEKPAPEDDLVHFEMYLEFENGKQTGNNELHGALRVTFKPLSDKLSRAYPFLRNFVLRLSNRYQRGNN